MITIKDFQVEYSTTNCFNLDSSWALFQTVDGRIGLFNVSTGELLYIVPTLATYEEPRWDSYDPGIFFHTRGNKIIKFDAYSKTPFTHKHFSEFVEYQPGDRPGLQGLGEGDIEGNFIALTGLRPDGKREIFMYDIVNNIKHRSLVLSPVSSDAPSFMKSAREHSLDNLYATPDGNCQVAWNAIGNDRFQGIELFDKEMNFIRQLASRVAHNDTSQKGLIWCSSADPLENKNAVILIDKDTNKRTELARYSWDYAMHISCCDKPYFVVSLFDPTNKLPMQIRKVGYDKSDELLFEDKINYAGYISQPRACLSSIGDVIAFNHHGQELTTKIIRVPGSIIKPIQPPIQIDQAIKFNLNDYNVAIENNTISLYKK